MGGLYIVPEKMKEPARNGFNAPPERFLCQDEKDVTNATCTARSMAAVSVDRAAVSTAADDIADACNGEGVVIRHRSTPR